MVTEYLLRFVDAKHPSQSQYMAIYFRSKVEREIIGEYRISPNKSALPNSSSPLEKPLNHDNIMNIS